MSKPFQKSIVIDHQLADDVEVEASKRGLPFMTTLKVLARERIAQIKKEEN